MLNIECSGFSSAMAGVYEPSDDSEAPVLRDFVKNSTLVAEPPQSDPEPEPHSDATSPTVTRRGPSSRYRRQRESAYSTTSPRELLHILITREYESSRLRKALDFLAAQLQSSQRRAEDVERQLAVYSDRFQSLNEDKVRSERELYRLEEELTLQKNKYDLAQKDIGKARETIVGLQAQVERAEEGARRAREDARKVKEAMEDWKARKKGRRQGFEAGWNRAREEFGIVAANPPQLEYQESVYEKQPRKDDQTMSYRTYSPPRTLLSFPAVPVVPPPQFLLHREPGPLPEPILQQEQELQHEPESIRLPSRSPSRSIIPTPAIQTYDIETPPANQIRLDNRPLDLLRRGSSFRTRNIPRPQVTPPPPLPIQRTPSLRPPGLPRNVRVPASLTVQGLQQGQTQAERSTGHERAISSDGFYPPPPLQTGSDRTEDGGGNGNGYDRPRSSHSRRTMSMSMSGSPVSISILPPVSIPFLTIDDDNVLMLRAPVTITIRRTSSAQQRSFTVSQSKSKFSCAPSRSCEAPIGIIEPES
ncbi:hypothetical protein GYMLUDRAFT_943298 [Collybiopsis luxurians FD-317 M1]|uniref:Uncharacterized protein n=1 Tax=Collybiopsis luxurians FD-317 M1 TaxID=944289 RepID=A0A0D0BEY6_9AGAR|nr:hypothetical protein GYMLUDRAFT_943298 [Collybiopsis luxurians FD-317 M1]